MIKPITWNTNEINKEGNKITVDIREKWINTPYLRNNIIEWSKIDCNFHKEGNNFVSNKSPWSVICPDLATKPIIFVNKQVYNCHTKQSIKSDDFEIIVEHPNARPVSPIILEGREFQVVYPNAIQDGIDIVIGLWHGRGTRAEHLYVFRSIPFGDNDIEIESIITLPQTVPSIINRWDGSKINIYNNQDFKHKDNEKKGITLCTAYGWYYKDNGDIVKQPIKIEITKLKDQTIILKKIIPRKLIIDALLARASGELRVDATSTFYPDSNPETTTVDGMVRHTGENLNWSEIRDGAGTDAFPTIGSLISHILCGDSLNKWDSIARSIYLFDTSIISSSFNIISAIFSIYSQGKIEDNIDWLPKINIYSSNPATNTNLVAGDFDSLGSIAFCDNPIDFSDFNIIELKNFVLNTNGILNIAKGGITKIGIREVTYDVANLSPTYSSDATAITNAFFADGAIDPKLVIEYIILPFNIIKSQSTKIFLTGFNTY